VHLCWLLKVAYMARKKKTEDEKLKLESAGLAIRQLREERKLSLDALAGRIGWDKGRLSRYENDRVGLSTGAIEHIAQGLELPSIVVLVHCLKHIYPALAEANSPKGKLLDRLVKEVLSDQN